MGRIYPTLIHGYARPSDLPVRESVLFLINEQGMDEGDQIRETLCSRFVPAYTYDEARKEISYMVFEGVLVLTADRKLRVA